MSQITGITKLYYAYLDHLRQTKTRGRIAPLQLRGKIEDYLTKEFVSFVLTASEGSRFAIVNSGNKNEPKIDLALIKNSKEGYIAESFIEAKYFQNRHRLSNKDMDAVDQHNASILELKRQLSYAPEETHGFHDVKLRSKTTKIYGLVFVSYVRPEISDDGLEETKDRREEYYKHFLQRAKEQGMQYHDLKLPYLRSVYEELPIDVLGKRWLITLKGALWRIAT